MEQIRVEVQAKIKMKWYKLKEVIKSTLKVEIEPDKYDKIDEYFQEVYLDYDTNGNTLIALKPIDDSNISPEFSALNGAYMQIDFWDAVKTRGKRIV